MPKAKPERWKPIAVRLYKELGSTVSVAETMTERGKPCSQSWVHRVCKDAGVIVPNPSYDEAMDDEIIRLATEEGLSQREIARRLPPSYTYVGEVFRERGIPAGGYERKGRRTFTYEGPDGAVEIEIRGRHSAEKCKAVLDAYAGGGRPTDLAETYDMPVSTIEKLVGRAGIKRSRSEARINALVDEGHVSTIHRRHVVRRMYVREEMSTCQIGERLDISAATVKYDLEKMGVELRSRSWAMRIARWGSRRAYHEFAQDAAYRIRVKGETKTSVAEDYDASLPTVNRALKYWDELRNGSEEPFWVGDGAPSGTSDGLTVHAVPKSA